MFKFAHGFNVLSMFTNTSTKDMILHTYINAVKQVENGLNVPDEQQTQVR
jgi:hypothetical protein